MNGVRALGSHDRVVSRAAHEGIAKRRAGQDLDVDQRVDARA